MKSSLTMMLKVATVMTLAAAMPLAVAGTMYQWTDANGVNHYGDRRPQDAKAQVHASTIPAFVEPTAIARLRIEARGSEYYVWAENHLSGPIEVMLHYSHHRNVSSDPALPARATVATGGSTVVAVLRATDPGRPVDFELRMDSLPGNPSATAGDTLYLLPIALDTARIDQGYGGTFSHDDPENRYAVDFAVPVGTPVIAARGGVVMQLESGFERPSLDRSAYAGRANFIRILHSDGTMSLYAHLKVDGVLVRAGQRVSAGQQIGWSGNTGFTTGPHLHFAVQVNRGMRLVSLPFRMQGVEIPPLR